MNNDSFYGIWKDMLAAYYEEELQFLEFNRLVPIKGNSPETFSIRLYDVLQSVCGQIESMMKILCDRLGLKYPKIEEEGRHASFNDLFKLLNDEGMLTEQVIYSIKKDNVLSPFIFGQKDHTPKWWKEYNDTKHNLPNGFKSGNIDNTIFALSALYALHCIAYSVYHSTDPSSVLKKENWYSIDSFSQNMYDEIAEKETDARPKSGLFYNLTKFGKGAEF